MAEGAGLLLGSELGWLAAGLASGASHGHAFAGPHPEEVDLEFGEAGEDVEEHLGHGVGGVVDVPAEGELDAEGGEIVADRPGVGHGASKPIEFRADEGVAFPYTGQRLVSSLATTVS